MFKNKLWLSVPFLSLLAMVCRWVQFHLGTDARGLLVPGHPAAWCLGALTLAALACVWFCGESRHSCPQKVAGVCSALLALSILLSRENAAIVSLLPTMVNYIRAGLLLALAICQWKGRKTEPVLYACLCVCTLIDLIVCYQTWSREPQLQSYLFALLGSLSLAAYTYQRAALELNMGSTLWCRRFALAGSYLLLAASVFPASPIRFYSALWLLCGNLENTGSPKES